MYSALIMHKKEFEGFLREAPKSVDLDDYEAAAHILPLDENPNRFLSLAFELTNSIDEHWSENEGVEVMGDGRHRSTSVGDLVWLNKDGQEVGLFFVDNFGFKQVSY